MQRVLVNSISYFSMSGHRSSSWKSTPVQQQTSLASFFCGSGQPRTVRSAKRCRGDISQSRKVITVSKKTSSSSAFGMCPICHQNIPYHRLMLHASHCEGQPMRLFGAQTDPKSNDEEVLEVGVLTEDSMETTDVSSFEEKMPMVKELPGFCTEPLQGLFLYEDFLTKNEESEILRQLDDTGHGGYGLSWKPATFNGRHFGQRWGVHCDLRSRQVLPAERPLPPFCAEIIVSKLSTLTTQKRNLQGFIPNEMNAIDYRKSLFHSLSAHVDDRHLSKEMIVNISLAGDCTMTFAPVQKPRASSSNPRNTHNIATSVHVLLKRRCLQVLTGPARYQYTHSISNEHLYDERRVSLTLRESPLTVKNSTQNAPSVPIPKILPPWWKSFEIPHFSPQDTGRNESNSNCSLTSPKAQALPPGLFLFPNFLSEEEEAMILQHLDHDGSLPKWTMEQHTGSHREKRWGVDHDIWSRSVRPPKNAIPQWMNNLLIQRFPSLVPHLEDPKVKALLNLFHPNDVNAIEYRRDQGHSLAAHVDDRQKHTEVIANLSLAGDCFMTYALERGPARKKKGHQWQDEYLVGLPRRTLQILTGSARYDYRHGIANTDLASERRISITLRETRP
jgi:alkylated DNA repair dioxygenase AlkB